MRTHAPDPLTTLAQTGKASQSFAYDYSGRRVRKTTAAFNAAPQLVTDYLYNSEHVYAEYLNSSFTTASAVNNHGAGIDEILSRTTTAGSGAGATSETTYLHQDHILSVALQTNATGNGLSIVKGGRIHDAWGNVSQQSPAAGTTNAITNAFGYTGREPEEAGLIYYRARYYDPSIGRFTQQDPACLKDGINTYSYVRNNPLSLIDPSGKFSTIATGNGLAFLGHDSNGNGPTTTSDFGWNNNSASPQNLTAMGGSNAGDTPGMSIESVLGSTVTQLQGSAVPGDGSPVPVSPVEPVSTAVTSGAANRSPLCEMACRSASWGEFQERASNQRYIRDANGNQPNNLGYWQVVENFASAGEIGSRMGNAVGPTLGTLVTQSGTIARQVIWKPLANSVGVDTTSFSQPAFSAAFLGGSLGAHQPFAYFRGGCGC
jgi:RHS repeat-associated protein